MNFETILYEAKNKIGYITLNRPEKHNAMDYQMLDDKAEVRRHLENVNEILSKIGSLPEDELDKLSWDTGVIGRSYYVTGAHMCQVIEEKAGKDVFRSIYRGKA